MYRSLSALAGVLLLGLVIACGGEEAAQQEREAAREAEWTQLQERKAALDAQRQELAELRRRVRVATEGEAEAEEDVAALEAEVAQLESEVADAAQLFYEDLVEFINSAEIEVGAEMPERVQAAIRLKSEEDILLAQEYIDQGGDYARAIEIYQTALQADPDNERLKEKIAWAEEQRWMSEERFQQVKKGMTREEVRQVLGQPNLHNIQQYPEKKAIAWFYPKGPDRSAAGVYFQQQGDDPYEVYLADFDAVEGRGQGSEGEG